MSSEAFRNTLRRGEAVKRGGGENQSDIRVMVPERWVQVVTETVGFQVLFRDTSPGWV